MQGQPRDETDVLLCRRVILKMRTARGHRDYLWHNIPSRARWDRSQLRSQKTWLCCHISCSEGKKSIITCYVKIICSPTYNQNRSLLFMQTLIAAKASDGQRYPNALSKCWFNFDGKKESGQGVARHSQSMNELEKTPSSYVNRL